MTNTTPPEPQGLPQEQKLPLSIGTMLRPGLPREAVYSADQMHHEFRKGFIAGQEDMRDRLAIENSQRPKVSSEVKDSGESARGRARGEPARYEYRSRNAQRGDWPAGQWSEWCQLAKEDFDHNLRELTGKVVAAYEHEFRILYAHPAPPAQPQGLTKAQIDDLFVKVSAEVAKLELEQRYTFAGWLPIAVRLIEQHHGIKEPK